MVLRESPESIGIAQAALLLPATLLLLVGGALGDRYGTARLAVLAQCGAVLPLLWLGALLVNDALTFSGLIVYALLLGTANAFLTPARDGLLNQVAGGAVQRTVVKTSLAQFGSQMLGFGLAMLADTNGPVPLVALQIALLLLGAWTISRLPVAFTPQPTGERFFRAIGRSLAEGARTVTARAEMRDVLLMNAALGLFFMGSYIVTLPILVRENYSTDSTALALMNMVNAAGLFVMIAGLLRFGVVARPGRAVLIAHVVGAIVLAGCALEVPFPLFLLFVFAWGLAGGVAMSMSRTVMQELAPAAQRARVMSFFAVTMMGAGPIGALFAGYLSETLGARTALVVCCVSMFSFSATMLRVSAVARLTLDGTGEGHQSGSG